MATGGVIAEYRGAGGATRTERILYSAPGGRISPVDVYRCVNASTHPELARQLMSSDGVNVVDCPDGTRRPVNVSVAYHAPARRIFVVVVPECARHTELTERADWLSTLAAETECEVPDYVRRLDVVFGGGELVDWIDRRDREGMQATRGAELSRELEQRQASLERTEATFRARHVELERVAAELEVRNADLQAELAELDSHGDRQVTIDSDVHLVSEVDIISSPDPEGTPLPRPVPHEEIQTNPFELMTDAERMELEARGVTSAQMREASDRFVKERDSGPNAAASDEGELIAPEQIVSEEDSDPSIRVVSDDNATTVGGGQTDVTIERWIVSREQDLKVASDAGVRLAATLTPRDLETFATDDLVARVQLHRMPSYPLVTIAVGDRTATEPVCFLFDVGNDSDIAVLGALAREFAFDLHLFDTEYVPVKRATISGPMSDNVRYALAAAEQHMAAILPAERSFARASIAFSDPDYDRHGRNRPERALFRRELLQRIDTPAQCRRALDLVAHFSKPEHEELLVLVWGEPLAEWNKARGRAVLKAVETGLWPGPDLARFAVSAGAARSRKDLVQRLLGSFTRTLASELNDLDDPTIDANWKALQAERAAVGLVAHSNGNGNGSGASIVSGTIGGDSDRTAATVAAETEADLATLGPPQLIGLLDNKDRRRAAAIELAMRGERAGLAPTFAILHLMPRAEAVQVLGHVTNYGDAATSYLLEALQGRKGFIRHGCALALGVLKDEAGIEAICDLLLSEPTEIWRELARCVGEVGAGAVMSLLSRLRGQDDAGRERVAWALAHVAARGAQAPVETLSRGRDPIAAGVARHALQLMDLARTDDRTVRGSDQPREVTVNRAFSRKFFEALDQIADAEAGEDDEDALILDEADLIEADAEIEDDSQVLDESDLIPT